MLKTWYQSHLFVNLFLRFRNKIYTNFSFRIFVWTNDHLTEGIHNKIIILIYNI